MLSNRLVCQRIVRNVPETAEASPGPPAKGPAIRCIIVVLQASIQEEGLLVVSSEGSLFMQMLLRGLIPLHSFVSFVSVQTI